MLDKTFAFLLDLARLLGAHAGYGRAIAWELAVAGSILAAGAWVLGWSRREAAGKRMYLAPSPEIAKGWKGEKVPLLCPLESPDRPGYIRCRDPATSFSLGEIKADGPEEVKVAFEKARRAQEKWARTTFAERRAVLSTLLEFITEHQEEICRVTCRDSGKTMVDAVFGEVLTTCEKLRWTIAEGEKVLQSENRSVHIMTLHKKATVEYIPMGVVAALVSWNYPFHNTIGPVISAIFAGNGILVKASEHTAWSARYIEEMIQEALRVNGHDGDLVQFLCGFAECGKAVIESGVGKITFIGSPKVGTIVMRTASERLTPCVLELGGKDCAIIRGDAALGTTIPFVLRGVFQNCGQNCIGLERIIVDASIYDRVVEECLERIQSFRVGEPLDGTDVDCGAMTMGPQGYVNELIAEAVQNGARLLCGREYWAGRIPEGSYFPPTLLVDVTSAMRIAQEEVFSPVMVVMRSTSDQEAVDIANSSPYGLGSSVFTGDAARGLEMLREIRSGMGNVNDFGINYLCQSLPFGGVGISGYDRFGGPEGLRGNCYARAVTTDRFPSLVNTSIPPVLQYPIVQGRRAVEFCFALVDVVYRPRWMGRIRGVLRLAGIC